MLFEPQISRKPNLYPWSQDIIDALWTSHWTPNEFNFRADHAQFYSDLSEKERGVIVRCLSAIGQIEIAVKRFWGDLGRNLPHPSLSDMGFVMANNEVIHNQAYEKLLDVLHLHEAFDECLKHPTLGGRVEYLRKYNDQVYTEDRRKQYIYAVILFSIFVENVSLFSQFYIIMWFNRFRNVLKDTAQQVQYTRVEEETHFSAGKLLISTFRSEYPEYFDSELEAKVISECESSLAYELEIIKWILEDYSGDNGLSVPVLSAYVKNRMYRSLSECGFSVGTLSEQESEHLLASYWMDEDTKGVGMTDFFHKRPVDYAKNFRTYNEEDLF
ncbi:MAG: ribonucleotide-diphosphate reductase subunit beta [Candidatus Riesia sp.]|nr:ribonucleotide-diphosphate reductase subunit beta [Candidatus Riesia sp.]